MPVEVLLKRLTRELALELGRCVLAGDRNILEVSSTLIRFKRLLEYTFHTNFDHRASGVNFAISLIIVSAYLPHLC